MLAFDEVRKVFSFPPSSHWPGEEKTVHREIRASELMKTGITTQGQALGECPADADSCPAQQLPQALVTTLAFEAGPKLQFQNVRRSAQRGRGA
jgi:hypothetical protein